MGSKVYLGLALVCPSLASQTLLTRLGMPWSAATYVAKQVLELFDDQYQLLHTNATLEFINFFPHGINKAKAMRVWGPGARL